MVQRNTYREQLAERTVNDLWWLGVVQGTLAILFGIVAVFWPGLTLITLIYLFSAFILAVGIVEIINGLLSVGRRSTWWMTLVIGLIALGVGVFLVRNPQVSFGVFILIVGITLIARGLIDLVRVFVDRANPTRKALSVIVGVAALVAGIIILLQPEAGGVAFVWILGLYALILGPLIMAISFDMRNQLLNVLRSPDTEISPPEPPDPARPATSSPPPTAQNQPQNEETPAEEPPRERPRDRE